MVIDERTLLADPTDDAWYQQAQAAARRYADTARERRRIADERALSGNLIVDTPEQINARAERLLRSGQVPVEALVAVGGAGRLNALHTQERVIGLANQLQSVNFLSRGIRAAATVARISLHANGRVHPCGTGSLVSSQLLLTNNHVLPDIATARQTVVEFGAERDADDREATPEVFRLDPDAFFVTDPYLDYTLVLVAPRDGRRAVDVAGGWNRLIRRQGKIVIGEYMNIVGHPQGRPKEGAVRDNRLEQQLPEFLHYTTDTEPGNSGSPVFNDQWEIVALHHSGVPRTDEQGRWLRRDGTPWHPTDGDAAVHWVANEGVRVSTLLDHLASLRLDARGKDLLDELGPEAGFAGTDAAPVPFAVPTERITTVPRLVFVHGRRQEGRDPEQLRREWTGGLNRGLAPAGLDPVDATEVCFPFYGDVLVPPFESLEAATAGPGALYARLIGDAAVELGMPPNADESALLDRLRDPLSWIADRTGMDELVIARFFQDVAAYLERPRIRDRVPTRCAPPCPRPAHW